MDDLTTIARANFLKNHMPPDIANKTSLKALVVTLEACTERLNAEEISLCRCYHRQLKVIFQASIVETLELSMHLKKRISQVAVSDLPSAPAVVVFEEPEPLVKTTIAKRDPTDSTTWLCKSCGQRGHGKRSNICPNKTKDKKKSPALAITKRRSANDFMKEESAKMLNDPRVFKTVDCGKDMYQKTRIDYRKIGEELKKQAAAEALMLL